MFVFVSILAFVVILFTVNYAHKDEVTVDVGISENKVQERHFVTDHYERRVEEYGNNIHGTLEAIQVQQRYVIATIYNSTISNFNNREVVIDIGGGDCVNADKLSLILQKEIWCIEPFMPVNISALSNAHYVKMDVVRFTEGPSTRYNFILFKEVIHHIPQGDYSKIFHNIYSQLLPDGAMVIMTRPKMPYFLFSKVLKERWAATSADLDIILPLITQAGFRVSTESHNFTMSINKSDWKRFIEDRTWSTFETLSEEEIQQEFHELDQKYPTAEFDFTDNCIFIIATKN